MLVNEENVMLEAGVEMRFEAEMNDHGIVMTVDVSVHTIESFEYLSQKRREALGERYS